MTATTIVIAIQAALLALVILFVVALLRSHAEILRRLRSLEGGPRGEGGPLGTDGPLAAGGLSAADRRSAHDGPSAHGGAAPPASRGAPARRHAAPVDLVGQTLNGDSVKLALGAHSQTLLAFLSSGCAACGQLWAALRDDAAPGIDARLVVVTHSPDRESVPRLRELAPLGCELVMSSQAWVDFATPGSPYFVLVDGASGVIAGQGVAGSWAQLVDLVRQSGRDTDETRHPSSTAVRAAEPASTATRPAGHASTASRAARGEDALTRAGIGAGHPSLYPSRWSQDGGQPGQASRENGSETR
jgi:hypothetical protein